MYGVRSEGPLRREHHARACCVLCRPAGNWVRGFAQDQSLRVSTAPVRRPAKSGKSAPSGLGLAPSAMVRASRSSARRLKVRRFLATSPRPDLSIGPAMGPRSSTAIARLLTWQQPHHPGHGLGGFRLREGEQWKTACAKKSDHRPPWRLDRSVTISARLALHWRFPAALF
jgi:hypothetical protein